MKRLEKKLAGEFKNDRYRYITCFGSRGSHFENLFLDDGVHVSKAGHKRMAELIAPVLMKVLQENSRYEEVEK